MDDAEWSSKIADEVCPEHSLLCQKLVSAFSDAVEFLMAIVSFRQAKEKLQTVCFEKVTRGTSGNAEGNVRLTRKKLLSITSDLQSSAPKELIEKVQECYKEKHESGKKKRKKKQCNPGYKRQAGDELRLVQKREIVPSMATNRSFGAHCNCAIYVAIQKVTSIL